MLPKRQRLTTAAFNRFFKTGRRFHSPLLTVCFTPYQDFHGSVVVGKKVFKSAVKRNRLRRRLYACLYQWRKTNHQNGVFIVLTKPASKDATFEKLKNDLVATLKQIESAKNPR